MRKRWGETLMVFFKPSMKVLRRVRGKEKPPTKRDNGIGLMLVKELTGHVKIKSIGTDSL